MSDNLRQYRAIRKALKQGYPGEPAGQFARYLTTLAALISGIVASKVSDHRVSAYAWLGLQPASCDTSTSMRVYVVQERLESLKARPKLNSTRHRDRPHQIMGLALEGRDPYIRCYRGNRGYPQEGRRLTAQ